MAPVHDQQRPRTVRYVSPVADTDDDDDDEDSAVCPADTLWLHVRSMGQWTNRLYEYFRQLESDEVSPTRLATSLRKRRQLTKAQVHITHTHTTVSHCPSVCVTISASLCRRSCSVLQTVTEL